MYMLTNDYKISEDLRTMAFNKTVEMLSGQSAAASSAPTLSRTTKASAAGEHERRVEKIARKLALSAEAIAEIYSESEEGGVELVIGVGKLDAKTAAATKQLALLIIGGRQLTESESEAPIARPHAGS